MAFDYFQQNDEEKDQQAQPQQTLGSESPVIQGNSGKQPAGDSEHNASGSFTNLNSYLDANKGSGFGQQVAGRVENTINQANKAQDDASSGFKSDVDKSTVQKDDALMGELYSNPNSIVSDDKKLAAWDKMRDARYEGPNTLSDSQYYQPAQAATAKAYSTAEQTKDESGRKAYLAQEYGANAGRYDYTSGQQKLDNLLIQQDPTSKAAFEKNWESAANTKNRFGTLSSALDQYAGTAKQTTADTRNSARSAVGIDDQGNWGQAGAMQDTVASLDARAAAQKAAQEAEYGRVLQSLQQKKAPTELELTGKQIFNLNPTEYLTQAADPNRSTIASAEDRAKIAALARLADKNQSFIDENAAFYDPSKLYNFDKDRLLQDAGAAEAEYKDSLANLRFLSDIGGGAVDSILKGGGSDLEKLSRVQDVSRNTNRPITHDDFGWNMPSRGIEEILAEYNDPKNQWWFDKRIYNDAGAMNYRRNQANQVLDLLKRVKGYGNTL